MTTPLPSTLPTPQTIATLVKAWEVRNHAILRGQAPVYCEPGWVGASPMSKTIDAVTGLVMGPHLSQAIPLLTTLLGALGPSHFPVVQAAHTWLLFKAMEAWIVASTVDSAKRCAFLKVFLDAGAPAGGNLDVASDSPLVQAIALGDLALAQALVTAGADPQETLRPLPDHENEGPTLLMRCPEQFPHKRQMGETLLHKAAIDDDAPMCAWLIGLGLPLGPALRLDGQPGRSPSDAARQNDAHQALAVIETKLLRDEVVNAAPGAARPRSRL